MNQVKQSNELRLAIANCIVEKLWVNGLITDEEKKKIDEKNKNKILSTNH